jgi:hypothetical protein
VAAVGINQRGKSNSIKDLLVRIARREHLEIIEGDTTPFGAYASAWLERKKATLARSTYGDYRSIWKKYVLPYFGNMPLCRVTRLDVEEFIRNRSRKDGGRFLEGLKEAETSADGKA